MCGIAGILSSSDDRRVEDPILRRMADTLRHRGPDDEGLHVDPSGRCGLAFRRLSIIDLAGGHQPISNEDGTIWLVFNGEIYNYRELGASLQAFRHEFATQSDSEVIVHAYEQWGEDFLSKLHGMFALALWDGPRRRLLLARDRLGKKPLWYARAGGKLCFASETKALLALPEMPRKLNATALTTYLSLQYVPATTLGGSAFQDIHQLPPGHWVAFDLDGRESGTPRPYWAVPTGVEKFAGTYDEAKQRLGDLLTRAVEKRLMSDVPLGAFLSGGVDSSLVVGLMRRVGVSPLRTFNIRFEDARYDESHYARAVARHFQTEHHEQTVTPRARDLVETLAYHFDQPFADSSAIPTYLVARHTREFVTVALTGDGGDECFGGYDRYRAAAICERLARGPRWLRSAVARLGAALPHGRAKSLGSRLYRLMSVLPLPAAQRYFEWIRVFDAYGDGLRSDFLEQSMPALGAGLHFIESLHDKDTHAGAAERAIFTDFHSYLPYDILAKVDLASMANSLECRSPFLDHAIVEFAQSLPIEWRIGARGGKRILKDWARDLLPPETLTRPKMGFGVPVGEWFRADLKADLRDALFASDSLSVRIFDRIWLEKLVDDHACARANHEHRLWALFMLEHWFRRWRPEIDLDCQNR